MSTAPVAHWDGYEIVVRPNTFLKRWIVKIPPIWSRRYLPYGDGQSVVLRIGFKDNKRVTHKNQSVICNWRIKSTTSEEIVGSGSFNMNLPTPKGKHELLRTKVLEHLGKYDVLVDLRGDKENKTITRRPFILVILDSFVYQNHLLSFAAIIISIVAILIAVFKG